MNLTIFLRIIDLDGVENPPPIQSLDSKFREKNAFQITKFTAEFAQKYFENSRQNLHGSALLETIHILSLARGQVFLKFDTRTRPNDNHRLTSARAGYEVGASSLRRHSRKTFVPARPFRSAPQQRRVECVRCIRHGGIGSAVRVATAVSPSVLKSLKITKFNPRPSMSELSRFLS